MILNEKWYEQIIEIITNQMSWTSSIMRELYKARWEVEIFFRDVKQQLHVESFIGTSENAVMIQIWTALTTILILKALKTQAKYGGYLSNLVAFTRLNLFVKVDLHKWLDNLFVKEQPWTGRVILSLFKSIRIKKPQHKS